MGSVTPGWESPSVAASTITWSVASHTGKRARFAWLDRTRLRRIFYIQILLKMERRKLSPKLLLTRNFGTCSCFTWFHMLSLPPQGYTRNKRIETASVAGIPWYRCSFSPPVQRQLQFLCSEGDWGRVCWLGLGSGVLSLPACYKPAPVNRRLSWRRCLKLHGLRLIPYALP